MGQYNTNIISKYYKQEMIRAINKSFKVPDCLVDNRLRENVEARAAIAFFLYNDKQLTQQSIGNIISKGHSNVIYLIRLHKNLHRFGKEYRDRYEDFMKEMNPIKANRYLCVESSFNLQRINK